jgi:hypothetical protein
MGSLWYFNQQAEVQTLDGTHMWAWHD